MTRRRRAGLVLVPLLAIGSASCSAGADGDHGAAVPAASSTAGAVAIAVAPVGSERDPAAIAAPVESAWPAAPSEAATATIEAPAAVAPPTAPATAAPEPSSLGVTATAQPACVRLGGTVEVRITTASRATLGLAAMYADHEPHGAMGFGEAGADGTYVWQVVVPADVPEGDASAIVGADLVGEDGSRRSGHAIAPFRVGAIGECP